MAPALTSASLSLDQILSSLPDSIMAVEGDNKITYVNNSTEQLLYSGARMLLGRKLEDIVPFDSPLVAIVNQVRLKSAIISEYDIVLGGPRHGDKRVDVHASPVIEGNGAIVIQLQERSIAQKISQQLSHRGAARSVAGMASVLAHEIKNPLSGIRGSAQLLEQEVGESDKELTRLICEETDRICALVDQMEVFSNNRPIVPEHINIHLVLEHVRKLAQNGFAKGVTFKEFYDPSIPSARGDKGQLIQVFLNLIKNAAEAVPGAGGEIILTTAYRHGVRVAVPGSSERMHLPLEICVMDNGPGIADDLKPHLFDPFVTTKTNGTGLGLALVAKIVGDHGGIIECDSIKEKKGGGTLFRVLLPSYKGQG
ncbi:two-component system sensor histidine kinase NtrB [Paremcibacter congregatus]|uniref:two-component system sensor histidine kinase NtrB n=1 Tax=Paremcibacter congregatus TaxID=2043170 RepID=UPI0019595985|nr:ATP-binding protein [Paremcibacter congregatus]|tara:strand:+ start:6430 stop:7533 length:1104 start_codon:yes stop_codon:yes gene_type:complete